MQVLIVHCNIYKAETFPLYVLSTNVQGSGTLLMVAMTLQQEIFLI